MRCSVRMIACVLDEVLISRVKIDDCVGLNDGWGGEWNSDF
ncbi:hypothetical protein [Campylobacter canadensis]|nr:hypothetical protein [Campylobacter canadensis]